MVRKRGGSRALGHRRRSKARDTEDQGRRGTKGHAATAASVAHAQKTPPPFAEDEVDLALSRNIAQLLYQAECEKIEVAQRAINVKTRWWNTMAHGRDLHHCPRARSRTSKRTPSSDTVANSTRGGQAVPYTLACAHGVQQCGPSCALASVLAVVSHFPEEATFSRNCATPTPHHQEPQRHTSWKHAACSCQWGRRLHWRRWSPESLCSGSSFRTGTWRSGSAPCVERPRCCTARAATSRQCPEAWWRCCRPARASPPGR
ncbi:hypothetical protein ERJ75_000918900 [Trypanosoma vivax]|nr:hypothetical protein ERJ75_000918900 [Trypanosoma vivax]